MPPDFLETQLIAYLRLRQALGCQMRAEHVLLPEFVAFLQAQERTGPIRAHLALEWASQTSARRGVAGAAKRLTIARRFLAYLQAAAPDTDVPAPALLPTPRRSKPSLFTPRQLTALFEAARASRPHGSLRPQTFSTLIGLLASTGLRVGEAIRLQMSAAKLDLDPPHFHILATKFHTSRIVPLHPSTAEQLQHYRQQRARLHDAALSDAFLVSEQGEPLTSPAVYVWCDRLCRRLAIAPADGGRRPCLMSFRHPFAVTCMRRWYEQGQDVHTVFPHLSVSLGHVRPQESYWYVTAVPELLGAAAQRCPCYALTEAPMMQSDLIAPHLQAFFANSLSQQQRLSPQTLISCRDTFRDCERFYETTPALSPPHCGSPMSMPPPSSAFSSILSSSEATPCVHAISASPPSGRFSAWSPDAIRTVSGWPRECWPFRSSAATKRSLAT